MNEEIIGDIREEAKNYFAAVCPSHNWSHVERVYDLCIKIGREEGADLFVLKLASLLHDIGREKEKENPEKLDHAKISGEIIPSILKKYNINEQIIQHVVNCVSTHRARNNKIPESKEAKILFDADKLDSIGAIGVARSYAWAGNKGLQLYSDKNYLGTGYEKNHSPLTEFNFGLKNVKNMLFTETAKKIAEERHNFMVSFFDRLNKEVKGLK